MDILLDTHIFLWFDSGSSNLSKKHKEIILNPANTLYLSSVSILEVTIKQMLGKLKLPGEAGSYLPLARANQNILSLPFDENCIHQLHQLPDIHSDPFDRMLICQARENDLYILTDDKIIKKYPVKVLK